MAWLVRRIGISIVLVWVVASVVFLAIHLVPPQFLLSPHTHQHLVARNMDVRHLLVECPVVNGTLLHGELGHGNLLPLDEKSRRNWRQGAFQS